MCTISARIESIIQVVVRMERMMLRLTAGKSKWGSSNSASINSTDSNAGWQKGFVEQAYKCSHESSRNKGKCEKNRPRIFMLTFDGNGPMSWLSLANQYFEINKSKSYIKIGKESLISGKRGDHDFDEEVESCNIDASVKNEGASQGLENVWLNSQASDVLDLIIRDNRRVDSCMWKYKDVVSKAMTYDNDEFLKVEESKMDRGIRKGKTNGETKGNNEG